MTGSTSGLLVVLIACVVCSVCEGFQAIGRANVQDGKCVSGDGTLYAEGEHWYDDEECMQLSCIKIKNQLYVDIVGCSMMSVPDNCRLEPQPGQYPDCCPEPICDLHAKKHNIVRREFGQAFGGRKVRT